MASIRQMLEEDAKTQEQREAKYGGDHVPGHANCGKVWAGILSQYLGIELLPLPAHLVELMMAGFKLCRAAEDPTDPDHYRDARVYVALAQDAKPKEEKISDVSHSIR